jgi:hypothetical protein
MKIFELIVIAVIATAASNAYALIGDNVARGRPVDLQPVEIERAVPVLVEQIEVRRAQAVPGARRHAPKSDEWSALEEVQALTNWTKYPESETPEPPLVQSDGGNDCMIVASQYYDRLETMPWRNILRVTFPNQALGHAYAAWKIKPYGNVWIGDGSGSYELQTDSTDIDDVLTELQQTRGIQILRGQWEFADKGPLTARQIMKEQQRPYAKPDNNIGSSNARTKEGTWNASDVSAMLFGLVLLVAWLRRRGQAM